MPPPKPLHASERKLGWFMLAAIPLPFVLMVLLFGIDDVKWLVDLLMAWVIKQWRRAERGSWLELSVANLFTLLLINLCVSLVILIACHLLHLRGKRRWLSPEALWLWSALYGFVVVCVTAICLFDIISNDTRRAGAGWRFFTFQISGLTLGLAITVLGFRAWRRRRREDRAALAADPAADTALPH